MQRPPQPSKPGSSKPPKPEASRPPRAGAPRPGPSKPTKPGPPKHARRLAAQPAAYFAVLTGCAPAGERVALWVGEGQGKYRLGLYVVHRGDAPPCLLGWASAPQLGGLALPVALPVDCPVRGPAGPSTLLVLGPGGTGAGLRRVHDAGMAKAMLSIRAGLVTAGWVPGLAWWTAYELARQGWTTKARLRQAATALGCPAPPRPAPLIETGVVLAWPEHTAKLAARLAEMLAAGKPCNHFVQELEAPAVQRWLKLSSLELAQLVLRNLAGEHQLKWTNGLAGQAVVLASALMPKPASEADQRVAQAVLARFDQGEGCKRAVLMAEYPAQQHVVQALFDADLLLEGPDGFVFARTHLVAWLKRLRAAGVKDVPGVGRIKEVLGLGRRAAEGLRALLVERERLATPVEPPAKPRRQHD